ncbi:unnamed protein product [Thelazia callipaeda]|uniref:NARG2_C domain-containing protein n=1 Tax=Thelazia callipaeda TaxID=103827 RepID=A0A158RBD7_THECL|nr:unnamed protein product [Thelazia callipaeda]
MSLSPSLSLHELVYKDRLEFSTLKESPKLTSSLETINETAEVVACVHEKLCPPVESPLASVSSPPKLVELDKKSVIPLVSPSDSVNTLHSLKFRNITEIFSPSPVGLACMNNWDSYIKMINESHKSFAKPVQIQAEVFVADQVIPVFKNEEVLLEQEEVNSPKFQTTLESLPLVSSHISSSVSLSHTNVTSHILQRPSNLLLTAVKTEKDEEYKAEKNAKSYLHADLAVKTTQLYYHNMPVYSEHENAIKTEVVLQNLINASESVVCRKLPPTVVDHNYCFVVDAEKISADSIFRDMVHWSHASRLTQYFYSDDMHTFYRVICIKVKGRIIAMKLMADAQNQTPNSLPRSLFTPVSTSSRSIPLRRQSQTCSNFAPRCSISLSSRFSDSIVSLTNVYIATRCYSFWKTCPSFHRIITLFDRVGENSEANSKFKKRFFLQYTWRNTKPMDKARVIREYGSHFRRKPFQPDTTKVFARHFQTLRVQAKCLKHADRASSNSSESLITFPVAVNQSAVLELSENDLLLGYSKVFSVEKSALDADQTMRNVLNCPVEYISKDPPMIALQNYCFVISSNGVDVDKIMKNSRWWWKQTSSNTRYYYSTEMKTFYRVDVLLCRGEIRCAYMRKHRTTIIEQVPLHKLFRVTRIFGHWKTCTNFHRIISDIHPVTERGIEFYGFQKRIFVQYLWRTEKQSEKGRVLREYLANTITIPRSGIKHSRTSIEARDKADVNTSHGQSCSVVSFQRWPAIIQRNTSSELVSESSHPSRIPRIRKTTLKDRPRSEFKKTTSKLIQPEKSFKNRPNDVTMLSNCPSKIPQMRSLNLKRHAKTYQI